MTGSIKLRGLFRKWCLAPIFFFLMGMPLFGADTITFQGRIISNDLDFVTNSTYDAEVGLYYGKSDEPVWKETHEKHPFPNGSFSIILGNEEPLTPDLFATQNVHLGVVISGLTFYFQLHSTPYALSAKVAEEVMNPVANNLKEGTYFPNKVTMNQSLYVGEALTVDSATKRVGVRNSSPEWDIDISGIVNATELKVNGSDIKESFVWQKSTTNTHNIYLKSDLKMLVLRPSTEENVKVDIKGNINADAYLRDERPIDSGLEWQLVQPDEIHISILSRNVGIEVVDPLERVDVGGGVLIGNRHDTSVATQDGTIVWDGNDFLGYTNGEWLSLVGVTGEGQESEVGYWGEKHKILSSSAFQFDADEKQFGLGRIIDDTVFSVQGFENRPIVLLETPVTRTFTISQNGRVGIAGDSPTYDLRVEGKVSAKDFYKNGVSLRLALVSGTYFAKGVSNNIYYDLGNVSIGQVSPDNIFEIAAPFKLADDDVPTKDPAITFTRKVSNSTVNYTIGVDADSDNVFRVEKSEKLGTSNPLFVSKEDRFGVGVEVPKANANVSGNTGFISQGHLDVLATASITVEGAGARMFHYPQKGALRAGYVDSDSPYSGAEWDDDNLGELSVGMGLNPMASGYLAHIVGGKDNEVKGAYSTVVGGANNSADGFFALGLGRGAEAKDHGSFVWADNPGISVTTIEGKTENQFLIRATNGVGFNTNSTSEALLTVASNPVLRSEFTSFKTQGGVTVSLSLSEQIFNHLNQGDARGKKYLNSDGEFVNYMRSFYPETQFYVFPGTFTISTSNMYNKLTSLYNESTTRKVTTADMKAVSGVITLIFPAGAKTLWESDRKRQYSIRVWNELVRDKYIKTDGTTDKFDFDTLTVNASTDPSGNVSNYEEWIGLTTLNNRIKALDDAAQKIATTSFQEQIFTNLVDFDTWKTTTAIDLSAQRAFESLVSEGFIDSDGNLTGFRPHFEFFSVSNVNTSDVKQVLDEVYDYGIFNSIGVDGVQGVAIQNPGKVGVGYTKMGNAALAVSGNVGIGKTDISTPLHIEVTANSTGTDDDGYKVFTGVQEYAFMVSNEKGQNDPRMVVRADGRVGIHHNREPDSNEKRPDDVIMRVEGTVLSKEFTLNTGETITSKPPVIVFQSATPNIYFISGNVGIGTLTPNSLLELSNKGGGLDPVITFDLDNTDLFQLGVLKAMTNNFTILGKRPKGNATSNLTVFNDKVGIYTDTPSASFEIHESAIMNVLRVATDNSSNSSDPLVVDRLGTKTLFVNGVKIEGSGTQFVPTVVNGKDLIYVPNTDGNIGIGTDSPLADVHVSGNFRVGSINVSNVFKSIGGLQISTLNISDNPSIKNSLYVNTRKLYLLIGNTKLSVSDIFSAGKSKSGVVTAWLGDSSALIETGINWEDSKLDNLHTYSSPNWQINPSYNIYSPGLVSVSGDLKVVTSSRDQTVTASMALDIGRLDDSVGLKLSSDLTYSGGFYDSSRGYTASRVKLIHQGDVSTDVTAMDVSVVTTKDAQQVQSFLTSGARGLGLISDVSEISVQGSDGDGLNTTGFRYSGVFMGDVGIGALPVRDSDVLTASQNMIGVNGSLIASSFNINERLLITTMNVANNALVVDVSGNVGIGTPSPAAKLDIRGTLRTTFADIKQQFTGKFLNFDNGRIVIDEDGLVGIGTSVSDGQVAQLEMKKTFQNNKDDLTVFHTISQNLTEDVSVNIQGLDIQFGSKPQNVLGNKNGQGRTATGIEIRLNNLKSKDAARVVGVSVSLNHLNGSTPNAAIFQGGTVGINTLTPSTNFPLDIQGTLRAKNIPNAKFLTIPEAGVFDFLLVTNNIVIGDGQNSISTINNLDVNGTYTVSQVDLSGTNNYNFGLGVKNDVSGEYLIVSKNVSANLVAADFVVVPKAKFTSKVGIGLNPVNTGLTVLGGVRGDFLTVNKTLSAGTIIRSSNGLIVDTEGRVGLGTDDLEDPFTIFQSPYKESGNEVLFSPSNNKSWNGAMVQAKAGIKDYATGLQFSSGTSSDEKPLGILALRTADGGSDPGSHLVFIGSTENVRLTSTGQLLFNRKISSSTIPTLDVNGDMRVRGNLSPTTKRINVKQIKGTNGMTISSRLFTDSTTQISKLKSSGLYLQSTSQLPTESVYLGLQTHNDALFLVTELDSGSIVTTDISATFNVTTPKSIPYYSNQHRLVESPLLASGNHLTASVIRSLHESYISSSSTVIAPIEDFGFEFGERGNLNGGNTAFVTANTVFTGLDVELTGASLRNTDIVKGLIVSINTLETSQLSFAEGESVGTEGSKYAAIFRGGFVGINVTSNQYLFRPSTNLHVRNEESSVPSLLVQAKIDDSNFLDALSVTANGLVGVGTSSGSAKLTLRDSAQSRGLSIYKGEASFFEIDGQVGIGVSPNSSAALTVGGDVSANSFTGSSLVANVLTVNNTLFVTPVGVGLGTSSPVAGFHNFKEITGNVKSQVLHGITISTNTTLSISDRLTGLSQSFETGTNNLLANDQTVTGIKVDLTSVSGTKDAQIVGLDVQMPSNQTTYHYLQGGFVGVGTSAPNADLTVVGTLKGVDFSYTDTSNISSLPDLNDVSVNSLVLNNLDSGETSTLFVSDNIPIHVDHLFFDTQTTTVNFGESSLQQGSVTLNTISAGVGVINTVNVGVTIEGVTSTPTFWVTGNSLLSGTTFIENGGLIVDLIKDETEIVFNTPTLNLINSFNILGNVISKRVYFEPVTSISNSGLFTDLTGHLKYKLGSSSFNLSQTVSGNPTQVPYFKTSGGLSDEGFLAYFQASQPEDFSVFRIGTPNEAVTMSIYNTIPENVVLSDFSALKSTMLFSNRGDQNSQEATFNGVEIVVDGTNLKTNDKIVGLVSSMNVVAKSSTQLPPGSDSSITGFKYSGLFLGGSVGVFPTGNLESSPNAALHVGTKGDIGYGFLVGDISSPGLIVSQNGLLGINISQPQVKTHIQSAANQVQFVSLDSDSLTVLKVSKNVVGVYEDTPEYALDIGAKSGVSGFRVDSTGSNYSLQVDSSGRVGIATQNPVQALTIGPLAGVPALSIGTSNQLIVSQNGKVGLTVDHPKYTLSFQGVGASLVNSSTSVVPSIKTDLAGSKYITGFVSNINEQFFYFGNRNRDISGTDPNKYSSDLIFNDLLEVDIFTSSAGLQRRMTFTSQNVVMGSESTSTATLVINPIDTTRPIFKISSSSAPNAIVVTANGFVGIGTSNPQVNLHVVGDIRVDGILDASPNGTTVIVPSLSYTSVVDSDSDNTIDFLVERAIIQNDPGSDIDPALILGQVSEINLNADVSKNFSVLDIIVSGNANILNNTTSIRNVFGLRVSVNELEVQSPIVEGETAAKYAAVFTGGAVGIGTVTPQYQLDVRPFHHSKTVATFASPTGNVAGFRGAPRELEGATNPVDPGSEMVLEVLPVIPRTGINKMVVSEAALRTIRFTRSDGADITVSQANATKLRTELINKNILDSNGYLHTNWETNLAANNFYAVSEGLVIPSGNVKRALSPYSALIEARVKVSDLGLSPDESAIFNNRINYRTLLLGSGVEPYLNENRFGGQVGINIETFNEAVISRIYNDSLVISGDMRVGAVRPAGGVEPPGAIGESLFFSGGPKFPDSPNSENNDVFTLSRYNQKFNESELQVNIGDDGLPDAESRLVIGYTTTVNAKPVFKASFVVRTYANLLESDSGVVGIVTEQRAAPFGFVGIGLEDPVAPLHVSGNTSGALSTTNFLMLVENVTTNVTEGPNGMAVFYNGVRDEDTNYISFLKRNHIDPSVIESIGAIEGDNISIMYSSPERDYAEYLLKEDSSEAIKPGDVVGIYSGKVSRKTKNADQVMVISSSPIVVGNWPGDEGLDAYALVAFLGQVPVQVTGPVNQGDYLVPSRKEDGTAVAVSLADLPVSQLNRILGRALETKSEKELKKVNALVGFAFGSRAMYSKMNTLKSEVARLSQRNEFLAQTYESKLQTQSKVIKGLKAKVQEALNE